MLQMMPVRDPARLEELNKQAGVSARSGYLLTQDDQTLGYILYTVGEEETCFLALSAPDDDFADGLYRSVFGVMMDIGMDKLRFCEGLDRAQLVRLGFLTGESEQETTVREIFARGCRGCVNKV